MGKHPVSSTLLPGLRITCSRSETLHPDPASVTYVAIPTKAPLGRLRISSVGGQKSTGRIDLVKEDPTRAVGAIPTGVGRNVSVNVGLAARTISGWHVTNEVDVGVPLQLSKATLIVSVGLGVGTTRTAIGVDNHVERGGRVRGHPIRDYVQYTIK